MCEKGTFANPVTYDIKATLFTNVMRYLSNEVTVMPQILSSFIITKLLISLLIH